MFPIKRFSLADLGKDSVIYMGAAGITIATQVLAIPVMLSHLTFEIYGKVGLFQASVALLTMLFPAGFENAVSRSIFEDHESLSKEVLGTAVIWVALSGAACFFLVILFSEKILFLPEQALMLAVISAVLQIYVSLTLIQFQMRSEATKFFILSVVNSVGALLFLVIGISSLGEYARYYSPVVAAAATFCIYVFFMGAQHFSLATSKIGRAYCLRVGTPLLPHSALNSATIYADRFILNAFAYDLLLGVYTLISQIFAMVQTMYASIGNAYTPWIYKRLRDKQVPDFRILFSMIMLLGAGLMLALSALQTILLGLVDASFHEIVSLLPLIAIWGALEFAVFLILPTLFYLKWGRLISAITFMGLTAKLTGLILLIYLSAIDLSILLMLAIGSSLLRLILLWIAKAVGYARA